MPSVSERLCNIIMTRGVGESRGLVLLFVTPLLLYAIGGMLSTLVSPYYLSSMADPAYAYLFNSLNLVYFQSPNHTDHPGTTLQLLGALVIVLKWVVSLGFVSEGHLYDDVLMHPEEYLASLSIILRILLFAAVFVSGLKIYRLSNSLPVAILFQLVPLLNGEIVFHYAKVNTEILQVSLAMLISSYLYEYLTTERSEENTDLIVIKIGVLLGAGIVTKIIFAPVLFVVLLIKDIRNKLTFLAAVIISIFVLTLPIITEYPRIFSWIIKLLVGHGRYGDSGGGLPDYSTYTGNILGLINRTLLFEVLTATFLLVSGYLIIKRYGKRSYIEYFIVYSLFMTATVMFVGKNVDEAKYILPMLVMSACGLALLCRVGADLLGKKYYAISFSIIFGIIGIMAYHSVSSAFNIGKRIAIDMGKVEVVSDKISYLKSKGCTVAMYYDAPYLVNSLDFGSRWSGMKWEESLEKLYPDDVLFNMWHAYFRKFGKDKILPPSVLREKLRNNACVVIVGSTTIENYGFPWASHLSPVLKSGKTGVYRIISAGN